MGQGTPNQMAIFDRSLSVYVLSEGFSFSYVISSFVAFSFGFMFLSDSRSSLVTGYDFLFFCLGFVGLD